MCTLALYFKVSPSLPLLVAANRDEFLERPTAEPRVISDDPWVVAGQDLSAGGTWFGVNEHGMVVGVLNRRQPQGPHAERRSRGLLCLEALQAHGPDEAVARLRRERGNAYNSFNLLVADASKAYVASDAGDLVKITALPPGIHLLTNLELNDPTCPRIAKSHRLFREIDLPHRGVSAAAILDPLRAILSDHTLALDPRDDQIETLCVHRPGYGTRSSAIVAFAASDRRLRFWYAPGPPCTTAYREVALPG